MNYINIINDEKITKLFKEIDKHNDNQFNHGLQHVKNVIENMIKLTKLLGIDEIELNYLLIACVLHDLGQLEGSENHYLRSKMIASSYLKDLVPEEWFNKITSAIEKHHEKNDIDKLPLFEHLLLFADKMDFTFRRLDVNYIKQNPADYFESHILDTDYIIENNVLKIKIITDKTINQDSLISWPYYPKITKRIEEFAKKLKINYTIELGFNDKVKRQNKYFNKCDR